MSGWQSNMWSLLWLREGNKNAMAATLLWKAALSMLTGCPYLEYPRELHRSAIFFNRGSSSIRMNNLSAGRVSHSAER